MRVLISIAFIILGLQLNAQQDSLRKRESDKVVMVDFAFLIGGFKYGVHEFYSLGMDKFIRKRFAIGMNLSTSFFDNDVVSDIIRHDQSVSFGTKWVLFPDKKFYLDPFSHLIYYRKHFSVYNILYRGGGVFVGLNTGYSFKNMGVGFRIQYHYTIGYATRQYPEPVEGFSWTYRVDYGIHLYLKF